MIPEHVAQSNWRVEEDSFIQDLYKKDNLLMVAEEEAARSFRVGRAVLLTQGEECVSEFLLSRYSVLDLGDLPQIVLQLG